MRSCVSMSASALANARSHSDFLCAAAAAFRTELEHGLSRKSIVRSRKCLLCECECACVCAPACQSCAHVVHTHTSACTPQAYAQASTKTIALCVRESSVRVLERGLSCSSSSVVDACSIAATRARAPAHTQTRRRHD